MAEALTIAEEPGFSVVKWSLSDADPDGEYYAIPRRSEVNLHVIGTWGAGGTVELRGGNDVDAIGDGTPLVLRDSENADITLTADAIRTVLDRPYRIRPVLSAGTGVTVSVYAHITSTR